MSESTDDRADMAALQSGDDAALDRLMLRWQTRLRGYLLRHTLSQADALDLAQETFVRIYRHRDRFDTRRRFSTWMFQIALNLLRDHLRRSGRRPMVALEAAPETAHDTSPRVETEVAETTAAVRDAIAALPDHLREVVVLAEYEHLAHAEIAEIIGATPKAVETRLYRAREQLRRHLQRWLAR